MSDATRADHVRDQAHHGTDEDMAGRHRGEASPEDSEAAAPHGKHRREGGN
ncbi:hypothetical protein RVR_2749 [Actinacidiphila reveromycinica]|uniref:Uncharacterized protein n=1 Tax=Actinacidiphila reveromycinica TaxID=659352 RepID=A0A7U3UQZ5_9ACTN|nr:hypothetical protein [Streptomyces sp. SN-593]BBA97139.1 hypothetical protein RVR_2749 [Streptomyces sp. SN-593]